MFRWDLGLAKLYTIIGGMDQKVLVDVSAKQLDRVLGFIPRADSKANFIFAVDTSLLALIALNFSKSDATIWYLAAPAAAAIALLLASIWNVYRCQFPILKGGSSSLVYFGEIAKRTEANFIKEMEAVDEPGYARELLAQAWRNSEIATAKFNSVKHAFTFIGLALLPFFAFLVLASWEHAQVVFK